MTAANVTFSTYLSVGSGNSGFNVAVLATETERG